MKNTDTGDKNLGMTAAEQIHAQNITKTIKPSGTFRDNLGSRRLDDGLRVQRILSAFGWSYMWNKATHRSQMIEAIRDLRELAKAENHDWNEIITEATTSR